MVYDLELGRMARSFDVFQGIRVHGIICCSSTSSTECAEGTLASSVAFEISVFGEGRVKMFSLQIETEQQVSVSFTLSQSSPKFANWVLDVSFFKVVVTTLSIYGMSQLLPWFFKFDILLIVTAGEDCTCRVWGLDGKHLQMIKEHTKSKYICCLHFACEDTLYVSTNHGYLYHARLLDTGEVEWTELVRLSDKVMDLFSEPLELCSIVEDWVAVGDGKGNIAIVGVICDACTPKVGFSLTWSAGME